MNTLTLRTRVFGDHRNDRITIVLNDNQYGEAIGVHSGMRMKTVQAIGEYLQCGYLLAPVAPYTISVNAFQFEQLRTLINGAA